MLTIVNITKAKKINLSIATIMFFEYIINNINPAMKIAADTINNADEKNKPKFILIWLYMVDQQYQLLNQPYVPR